MSTLELHQLKAALNKLLSECNQKQVANYIVKDLTRALADIQYLERVNVVGDPPSNISTEQI